MRHEMADHNLGTGDAEVGNHLQDAEPAALIRRGGDCGERALPNHRRLVS